MVCFPSFKSLHGRKFDPMLPQREKRDPFCIELKNITSSESCMDAGLVPLTTASILSDDTDVALLNVTIVPFRKV